MKIDKVLYATKLAADGKRIAVLSNSVVGAMNIIKGVIQEAKLSALVNHSSRKVIFDGGGEIRLMSPHDLESGKYRGVWFDEVTNVLPKHISERLFRELTLIHSQVGRESGVK